jgi:hypothetical protein
MDKIIKATYYGNTPETCRHIIRSYLEYSQFGKLIEEHPNNYQALEPFEGWWNEYISDGEDEFVEEDEPMSINKWRGILQELAQRCPPDRWADDHQEGPSPDTFECGYCCALMQLHAISMREGHCIPIDEFPMPMRAIPKQQEQDNG